MKTYISLRDIALIDSILSDLKKANYKDLTPEEVGRLSARALVAHFSIQRIMSQTVTVEVQDEN
jgi:hypothetical protein